MDNNLNEIFASNLNVLLKLNNMTQESLAKNLGKDVSTVSLYCNGKRFPNIYVIKEMCRILKVDYNTLLGFNRSE